jgi:peptidoglycan/LPS O-acetylase OafA/YrhL
MVVVFHSSFYVAGKGQLHGGIRLAFTGIEYMWLGVPLFFVISGYCISSTCDSMRRKRHSARTYFWRRYRRIFPPFWAASLLVCAVVVATKLAHQTDLFADRNNPILDPFSLSIPQWLGNLTLTESWRGTLFGGQQYFLGPTWSLCYEEQFYLICGLLLFLSPWRFFRNALLVSLATIAVAMVGAIAGLHLQGFFFDGRWLMFALGILVYWLLIYAPNEHASKLKWGLTVAAFPMALAILYQPLRRFFIRTDERILEIAVAFVFAVVILHLRRIDQHIRANRLLVPISFCGTMCYSLYLIHWPVVKVVSHALAIWGVTSPLATLTLVFPLCVVASVVAARLFFLGVERHFLNSPPAMAPNTSQHPLKTPERIVSQQVGHM